MMKQRSALRYSLLLSSALALGVCTQRTEPDPGPPANFAADLESNTLHASYADAKSLADSFEALISGPDVRTHRGVMKLMKRVDCNRNIPVFGNCFGFNPAAPYIVPAFPPAKDEYIDPYYGHAMTVPNQVEQRMSWRMRNQDARVLIGLTPPRGAYFGYQTYVFSREGRPGAFIKRSLLDFFKPEIGEVLFGGGPNPDRMMLFAGPLNAVNQKSISASLEKSDGFQELVALVTTADKRTARLIKDKLIAAGLTENRIFVEGMPEQLRYGHGKSADEFMTLIRYALPDPTLAREAEAYQRDPQFIAMRLEFDLPESGKEPFPQMPFEKRTATSEARYSAAKYELMDIVRDKLKIKDEFSAKSMGKASSLGLNGLDCLVDGMNCLGETQDTDTYRFSSRMLLDEPGATIAVVGVDHSAVGNATYVSLSVNNSVEVRGVAAVSQTGETAGFVTGQLRGSADRFLAHYAPSDETLKNRKMPALFVHFFARDCGALIECTEISEDPVLGIPHGVRMGLLSRAYLRPGTWLGPDPDQMESPLVLRFTRTLP